jgi:hypothetical protein
MPSADCYKFLHRHEIVDSSRSCATPAGERRPDWAQTGATATGADPGPPAATVAFISDGCAMSMLKNFVNKGVRLIVADDSDASQPIPAPETHARPQPSSPPPPLPPRGGKPAKEREIPPEALQPAPQKPVAHSEVPADVADFGAVYEAAGIELPLHGYGIDKVADMLQSKRLASLGREVKATAVMAALEAAEVSIRDVIQDAVARDHALDAFEAAKERQVADLRGKTEARIVAIREEIDAFLKAKNTEIEDLKRGSDKAQAALIQLQAKKRQAEERLYDLVSHFVEGTDNPITTAAAPGPVTAPTERG